MRGLKNKLRRVQEEVKRIRSALYILCETRARECNLLKIMKRGWGKMHWFFNHNNHQVVRILMVWNPEVVNVTVVFCSAQLVHVDLEIGSNRLQFSAIYSFNDAEGRGQQ